MSILGCSSVLYCQVRPASASTWRGAKRCAQEANVLLYGALPISDDDAEGLSAQNSQTRIVVSCIVGVRAGWQAGRCEMLLLLGRGQRGSECDKLSRESVRLEASDMFLEGLASSSRAATAYQST